jgi:putative hydrolase of the HAD superfamily
MHDFCVVFDVDDTLYLERDYVASGFQAVGDWATQWLSIPDFASRCLDLFRQGGRGNIFDTALQSAGHNSNAELIAGMVEIYRTHTPCIAMAEDAAIAIAEIRRRWPIAVITDGPVASQSRKCDALGLRKLADPILLTGVRGERFHKPQLGAFEFVAASISAANYVYIADNPAKDFTAPRHLGWYSVRIRRTGGLHCGMENSIQPDFELPDLRTLHETLSAARAKVRS